MNKYFLKSFLTTYLNKTIKDNNTSIENVVDKLAECPYLSVILTNTQASELMQERGQ